MKKLLYFGLCLSGLITITSCGDFLETSTPSETDANFVFSNSETSRAALEGAYEQWRVTANDYIFGAGLFYAADIAGSDIERHPENFSNQPGRHWPECFYQNGAYAGSYGLLSYLKEGDKNPYANLFSVISKANQVIKYVSAIDGFGQILEVCEPSAQGQIYGEAVALKAVAYRELLKYFGDVPYLSGKNTDRADLCGRDSIYDVLLDELQTAAPNMYRLGAIPGVKGKNYMSRTFVEGLIGRMALEAGGYQTRRGDIRRVDGKGNVLTFEIMGTENNGAFYGRRSDWRTYYELAKKYFKAVIDNPGTARFVTTDPRTTSKGRSYNNPYQYFFEQMHQGDEVFADESIYEYVMTQAIHSNERPYSNGRPSTAGNKNYPCKAYGQARINPAFYYGMFDPSDLRRDVSCVVTGSDGASGTETLIPLKPGSQAKGGGISLNKWDENRQKSPYVTKQRQSGINGSYMRMAEIYLGYAEACAALGEDEEAKNYLTIIRDRAFGGSGKGNVDEFIAKEGSLLEAIIDERGFEYAGEGDRRWTLIRTGLVGRKIMAMKELTRKMIDGLEKDGYYQFENGNVISNYIWTKTVDAKSLKGHRLTAQCMDESDPVLFPGWRGVNDDWTLFGLDYKGNNLTNLAIRGLFTPLTTDEIEELEADGYKKTNWAVDIVNNRDEYDKYFFYDYDGEKAPIYLWPFTPNVCANGGFTNGYGFKNTENGE
jgi:hypothetical protein